MLFYCLDDDDDVLNEAAPGSSSSSRCHVNADSFIRHLCFDSSFYARHPASSCDDVISGWSGSANGDAGTRLERRDGAELPRFPLVDRQLGDVIATQSRDPPTVD